MKERKPLVSIRKKVETMFKTLIEDSLRFNATSKTIKYFWKQSEAICCLGKFMSGEDAAALVSNTLRAISLAKYVGKVTASNGDTYDVSEYAFPANFNLVANTRYLYLNTLAQSLHKYVDTGDIYVEGDVLTPTEVAKFFELYNAAQADTSRLATSPYVASDILISDAMEVQDSDGNWYATNDGYLTNYVGYVAGIEVSNELKKYLRQIPSVDKTEVLTWMVR